MIDKINVNTNNFNQKYWSQANANFTHSPDRNNNLSLKQKSVILASSAAGMAPVLGFLAHRKGFSLNPARILKTPIKDWAIFKYKPKGKYIEFEEPQIIACATGSVAGGYVGGALVDDKSNLRAKKREVLSQLLGDVIVPIACVGAGARIFCRYQDKLVKMMPKINITSKIARVIKPRIFNAISENIPSAIATIGSLAIGIIAGNKVSNEINEKLYNKKVERGIKATDFAPHVDDLCMSASMVNKESEFGAKLGRVIPLALLVPGYETGTAQEK